MVSNLQKEGDQQKTLLIMAGGTGGHVFPALSVAQELVKDGVNIVWLGTKKGIESRLVPEAGYEIYYLSIEGLVGTGLKRKLLAPWTLLRAVIQAFKVIIKVKPQCVLGMGGFASGPGGIAAKLLRKRIVIHEQNAFAGLTNRKLSTFADSVLTGFRLCEGLPETRIWVGNPVRKEIFQHSWKGEESVTQQTSPTADNDTLNILVLGGSQGAVSLNQKLPICIAEASEGISLRIWHQTGVGNSLIVNEMYKGLNGFISVLVEEFIDDINVAYDWADLVICRAGAMTISELMAAGKPSMLVPYPFAAGDHQSKNARFMVNADAALMVADDALDKGEFTQELKSLLKRPEQLFNMASRAAQLHRPKAARQVADFCQEHMNA